MESSESNSLSVIDGVKVWTDEEGITHFKPVDEPKTEPPAIEHNNRSWLGKLVDWWKGAPVKPYIKIRDLADPFGDRTDPDAGSDGAKGAKIGIKISF